MVPPSTSRRPRLAVVGLSAAMALTGGWLVQQVEVPAGSSTRQLPLLALVALFLVLEPVRLHLQVRRFQQHAQTITFHEIPLALGLVFVAPRDLLLAGVAAPLAINLWARMCSVKQVFNVANRCCDVAISLTLYTALVPDDRFSTAGWAVLCLAVACSGATTALLVTVAITLSTGRVPREDLHRFLLTAAPVSATVGTIGFVAALAWQPTASGVAPLVVCLVLVVAGLRGFSLLGERHRDLVALHGWSHRLTADEDVDVLLGRVLDAAVDLLGATDACVRLVNLLTCSGTLVRRAEDGTLERSPAYAATVPEVSGVHDGAVHARAPLGPGELMILTVSGRTRAQRPFRGEDARLLELVADQVALALRNGSLIERIRQEALRDALTGLPNRAALVDALTDRTADLGGSQVLWLGLRDLQVVNEALGYDSGDELLRQVATRLREAVGADALVARVDGDEFAVLAPCSAGSGWCARTTAAVQACFSAPYSLTGVQVAVSASIGQSGTARPGAGTALHLLRHADTAMRAARRRGHDVEHYTPALDTGTADRLALVVDLQQGIGRDELVLYAQPQVRLSDGAVTGVEALVRWQHPTLGLLPPAAFLPLAEQTRLDEPLTRWVLDAALRAVAAWRRRGLCLTVAVNVPARAVSDPQLARHVAAALSRHEVPGSSLVLEITESGLLDNPTGAAEVLTSLAALGITVSVDDFGTGFSSLSHLKRLPVDEIKIDRSFVSSMLSDQDDAAIVRSVVQLAGSLGLVCVAEGIEDEATYAALRDLGCDTAQGYLMAAPMPVDDVATWLEQRRRLAVVPVQAPPTGRRRAVAG